MHSRFRWPALGTKSAGSRWKRSGSAGRAAPRSVLYGKRCQCSAGTSSLFLGDGAVTRDNLHENLLEILLSIRVTQFAHRSLGQKFAVLDDAHDIAHFFDFTHDVGREHYRLPTVTALAYKGHDCARRQDIEPHGRLIEDHYR